MILVLDTESSGLQRDALAWDDPAQPHMVQLAAKLVLPDTYEPVARMTCIIKPDGWTIEPEAERVHGISMAKAVRCGVSLIGALVLFRDMAMKASTICAHHAEFDRRIIAAATKRAGAEGLWWQRCGPKFRCTMEESAPIVQLPGEFGFKFPKLEEAHRFFFPGMPFAARHDAEYDMDACERIYRAITAPNSIGPDGKEIRL